MDIYLFRSDTFSYLCIYFSIFVRSSLCFFFLSHSLLSSSAPSPFPSLYSQFTHSCHLTSNLLSYSPPVPNAPLILTNTCNSRTTDSHCSSMPQSPLDTTGPTKHYRPHLTLQSPLNTTKSTGHHRPQWTLQIPVDTIDPTGHYRPHRAQLETTGPTGYYRSHWTLQAQLDTTGLTGPHWTLQAPPVTTDHTGHYRPNWTLQASQDPTGHYRPHWAPQALLWPRSQTAVSVVDHMPH